jgi:hypothetical protein
MYKPTLIEFDRLRKAQDELTDLGDSLLEAWEDLLLEEDSADIGQALLLLDTTKIFPMIIKLRGFYCQRALDYLDADPLKVTPITVRPRHIEE